MRFLSGSWLLGGLIVAVTGCSDVPPATDVRPPQEETRPGADIAPENLPYSTENEEVPAQPVAPDEATGLRPSRFQELEESPASDFPQLDQQPGENAPNLLDGAAENTSQSDF